MKLVGHLPTIDPGYESPAIHAARAKLSESCKKLFRKQKAKAAHKAAEIVRRLSKAIPILKAGEEDDFADGIADEIFHSIEIDFLSLPVEATDALADGGLAGVSKGLLELHYNNAKMIARINQIAYDWASDRGAELVGMKYDADGLLIENPNARWVISDTTRKQLRVIVRDAFSQETHMSDLVSRIEAAGSFQDWRADMIARTEVAYAQAHGNMAVWKHTGVVESCQWLLSDDHDDTIGCDCEDNDGEIVKVGETFPSGDETSPAHPRCMCVVVAVDIQGESDSGDEEEADKVFLGWVDQPVMRVGCLKLFRIEQFNHWA
jgi:hypothetical protein